ncbi:hypothetical protein [Streptomyces sp. NPDC003720]|uniref:hypothetical protein n=1 Tax=Streptomyces sp. NPDC003720 TaxID=3364684 RepID=UPI0036A61310
MAHRPYPNRERARRRIDRRTGTVTSWALGSSRTDATPPAVDGFRADGYRLSNR